MPALPPLPGALRLRLIGANSGYPWNAVQYATYMGAPPNDTQCQTIGTQVGAAWMDALSQIHHTTVSLAQVEVTDLSALDAGVGVASVSHTGTLAGTRLPLSIALVASYKIHVRYRGGHPRTYWPAGVVASTPDGRTWDSAFRTLAQGACVDYVGNINAITHGGSTLTFVAVSYYQGKDPETGKPLVRATPLSFPVTTVTVGPRIDTQRRRLGAENN